jgi:dTMP kinase
MLNDEEVHALFAQNRWEFSDVMIEDIKKGVDLVVDRYAFSGVAYTSAKVVPVYPL